MKVKVIWNSTKKWAIKAAEEVKSFLKQKKIRVVKSRPDFTIVIGGDGTIIYHREKLEGLVFGIGSEKSFICQSTRDNWREVLSALVSKPSYEERMMLEIIHRKKKYTALNDGALMSRNHDVITVSVGINGDEYCFDADGVVVSSPTGSTAYAYSAGGPVIEPSIEAIGIVPVAPDKRLFDPVVVGPTHRIFLSSPNPAHLVIDGKKEIKLKKGEKVRVSRHRKTMKFAVVP
ncbi:MAG: NAD(+)/NADH kinase [Candidatus Micrarchaeia archaeon]